MTWALRFLVGPLLSAHLLTTSKLEVVWPAAIVRPPGAAPPGVLPCQYILADADGGLCIGRSRADHWGLGGHRPPTSGTRYIPVHYLLLLSGSILRVEYHSYWWYTGLMTNADLEDLCYEVI